MHRPNASPSITRYSFSIENERLLLATCTTARYTHTQVHSQVALLAVSFDDCVIVSYSFLSVCHFRYARSALGTLTFYTGTIIIVVIVVRVGHQHFADASVIEATRIYLVVERERFDRR